MYISRCLSTGFFFFLIAYNFPEMERKPQQLRHKVAGQIWKKGGDMSYLSQM